MQFGKLYSVKAVKKINRLAAVDHTTWRILDLKQEIRINYFIVRTTSLSPCTLWIPFHLFDLFVVVLSFFFSEKLFIYKYLNLLSSFKIEKSLEKSKSVFFPYVGNESKLYYLFPHLQEEYAQFWLYLF